MAYRIIMRAKYNVHGNMSLQKSRNDNQNSDESFTGFLRI